MLFTADEVRDKVAELGQQICKDYKGKKLAIIGVLNGAFIFTAGGNQQLCNSCIIMMMLSAVAVL